MENSSFESKNQLNDFDKERIWEAHLLSLTYAQIAVRMKRHENAVETFIRK